MITTRSEQSRESFRANFHHFELKTDDEESRESFRPISTVLSSKLTTFLCEQRPDDSQCYAGDGHGTLMIFGGASRPPMVPGGSRRAGVCVRKCCADLCLVSFSHSFAQGFCCSCPWPAACLPACGPSPTTYTHHHHHHTHARRERPTKEPAHHRSSFCLELHHSRAAAGSAGRPPSTRGRPTRAPRSSPTRARR